MARQRVVSCLSPRLKLISDLPISFAEVAKISGNTSLSCFRLPRRRRRRVIAHCAVRPAPVTHTPASFDTVSSPLRVDECRVPRTQRHERGFLSLRRRSSTTYTVFACLRMHHRCRRRCFVSSFYFCGHRASSKYCVPLFSSLSKCTSTTLARHRARLRRHRPCLSISLHRRLQQSQLSPPCLRRQY